MTTTEDPRVATVADAINKSGALGCGCCASGLGCEVCDNGDGTYPDHECGYDLDRSVKLARLVVAALDKSLTMATAYNPAAQLGPPVKATKPVPVPPFAAGDQVEVWRGTVTWLDGTTQEGYLVRPAPAKDGSTDG